MRIAHYVVYDPFGELGDKSLHVFEMRGDLLIRTDLPVFPSMGLSLIEWQGEYEGLAGPFLRWATLDGVPLPTGAEAAATERERADTERERAERLAARLRALGVDPDSLA